MNHARPAGGDLAAAVAAACPDGVDVYFDNTAGAPPPTTQREMSARGGYCLVSGVDPEPLRGALPAISAAGAIHDAAMKQLRPRARVIVCGTVALAGRVPSLRASDGVSYTDRASWPV